MKMAASAPFMKQCSECDGPIDDYTNNFIHHLEDNFGEIEDCQAFLSYYKKYPNSVSKCMVCLPKKWRLIKCETLKNRRQHTQKTPLENYPKNTYVLIYKYSYWVLLILTLILAFSLPFLYTRVMTNGNNENKSTISEEKLTSVISKLKDQFPSLQRGLLKKINGAFSRLKSPGEPFVLLLLHDDSNKKTTDCLASFTSIIAKQNIFTDTPKSLWMNATEWSQYSDQDDQNLLNEKLITPLKENEVLVLENLQDLPWSLANSFHYLCDSENPQIAKAMYILELKVTEDDLYQLNDGDKIMVAERTMNTAWINAPNSFRAALITRLTSYVDAVLLRSEKECSNDLLQSTLSEISFIKISP